MNDRNKIWNENEDNPDILCVGKCNCDIVIHADKIPDPEKSVKTKSRKCVGGGASNTALMLCNTPDVSSVYLATSIGDDDRGGFLREEIEKREIKLITRTSQATTLVRALITRDADPRYLAENEDMNNQHIDPSMISSQVWKDIDHIHLSAFDGDMVDSFLNETQNRDLTVSINPTQGFENLTLNQIKKADLIQLNEGEFESLMKNGDISTEEISSEYNVDIIVTHSGAGCTLYSGSDIINHDGYRVNNVIDTVGAGDSFAAGLISSWKNNHELIDCVKRGNAFGAFSVQSIGCPDTIDQKKIEDIVK